MTEELSGQMCIPEVAAMIQDHKAREYQAFVDKFKDAKTTDDCYTPPEIYDGLADWVAKEYGYNREQFLRPFRPGGDYQREEYPEGCAVVDNPPFSILAQIVDWYIAHEIPFFLFGPTLTIIGLLRKPQRKENCCVFLLGNKITYQNGATVQTSYITNMDQYQLRIEGDLRKRLEEINDRLIKEKTKSNPKYGYPGNVITGRDYWLAKYGQTFRLSRDECVCVPELDEQKKNGKQIFGSGLIISDRAAARKEALWKAGEKVRLQEKLAAEEKAEAVDVVWTLSERERALIEKMNGGEEHDATGTNARQ